MEPRKTKRVLPFYGFFPDAQSYFFQGVYPLRAWWGNPWGSGGSTATTTAEAARPEEVLASTSTPRALLAAPKTVLPASQAAGDEKLPLSTEEHPTGFLSRQHHMPSSRAPPKATRVRFVISEFVTSPGQELIVVGSCPALGSWDAQKVRVLSAACGVFIRAECCSACVPEGPIAHTCLSWLPDPQGARMTWHSGHRWTAEVTLDPSCHCLEYKASSSR